MGFAAPFGNVRSDPAPWRNRGMFKRGLASTPLDVWALSHTASMACSNAFMFAGGSASSVEMISHCLDCAL